jgi:CMP/dCMP kinase
MTSASRRTRAPAAGSSPHSRLGSFVIAIDGPAGSGKSTVARGVARALGLRRLDTGAMYRAVTLEALRSGVSPDDGPGLARTARRLRFAHHDSELSIDGKPVGAAVRRPEVSKMVSAVAAHPAVRRELVRKQRELIGRGGVVVEGRDIGTVVCPDADLKVFLTASPAERARRRHRELAGAGVRVAYRTLKQDLDRRDALDSNRKASPLKAAGDAVQVDSTGKTPRGVVAEIVRLAGERVDPAVGPKKAAKGKTRRARSRA